MGQIWPRSPARIGLASPPRASAARARAPTVRRTGFEGSRRSLERRSRVVAFPRTLATCSARRTKKRSGFCSPRVCVRWRGRAVGVEGVLEVSGTCLSSTWTAGSRGNADAAPPASMTFSTDLGHPRSNQHVHTLDLVQVSAGKQIEREKREWGAGEHAVNPTGSAPSLRSPRLHDARPGLGFLGCSSRS